MKNKENFIKEQLLNINLPSSNLQERVFAEIRKQNGEKKNIDNKNNEQTKEENMAKDYKNSIKTSEKTPWYTYLSVAAVICVIAGTTFAFSRMDRTNNNGGDETTVTTVTSETSEITSVVTTVTEDVENIGLEETKLDAPGLLHYGDLSYRIIDNEITIVDCLDTIVEANIPSEIDGYPVTKIDDYAFWRSHELTKVNIPDSIEEIGSLAFADCEKIETIYIPYSVRTIGNYFVDRHIKYIEVDERNDYFCDVEGVLYTKDMKTLVQYPSGKTETSYSILESVEKINEDAFYWNEFLEEVFIPDSVNDIGRMAFCSCSKLKSINIPEKITEIKNRTFAMCYELTYINLPENLKKIGDGAFNYCNRITSINIPNKVEFIGAEAFKGCAELNSIIIPDSVTYLGNYVFQECTKMQSIEMGKGVNRISDFMFSQCEMLNSVNISNYIEAIGVNAFGYCKGLNSIEIPESVKEIGDFAFGSCDKLTEIKVDSKNTNYCDIDGVLFNKNKTEIISYPVGKMETHYSIPKSVNVINQNAFYFAKIVTVDIPDSVIEIKNSAFESSMLNTINIPGSVIRIGEDAFRWTPWYEQQPDGVVYISDFLYKYKYDIQNIIVDGNSDLKVKEGTKYIAKGAFEGAGKFNSIEIPESLIAIDDEAFASCAFNKINIPNSVEKIGNRAFAGSGIENILIPESVKEIGEAAFDIHGYSINVDEKNRNYTSVDGVLFNIDKTILMSYPSKKEDESYIVPNSVKEIGTNAFSECSFKSLTIGENVEIIQDYAFANLPLKSIVIPNSVKKIGGGAFSECRQLESIVVGKSVESIESGAFWDCSNLVSMTLLNPDTQFDEQGVFYHGNDNLTFIGSKNSDVERYANENYIYFMELKNE